MIITEKHYNAIRMILEGSNMTDVAKSCGISRTTLYNWMDDKNFKAELDKAEQGIKADLNRNIGSKVKTCIEEMFNLAINSPSDKVRHDSLAYIIDRYLGRPTKVQQDITGEEEMQTNSKADIQEMLKKVRQKSAT